MLRRLETKNGWKYRFEVPSRSNPAKNGKGSLRTPVALLFALLAAPVAFGHQQKIYELKGDALGETLAAFKERHPQVQCTRYDDVTISCSDKDVAFAGHSPFLCEEKLKYPCLLDGLSADFYRGRLKFLNYRVSWEGPGGDPFELLSKKYGKPGRCYNSSSLLDAVWISDGQQISLQIVKDREIGEPELSVTLEYVKDPGKGDI